MSLYVEIINAPTKNTVRLLSPRVDADLRERLESTSWDALALVSDGLVSLFAYADIAEKAADVLVVEIRGACPQHVSMLAILGSTSAVNAAVDAIVRYDEQKSPTRRRTND